MEWFVVLVFGIFILGLVWVSLEAILHSRKSSNPKSYQD